ncbi:uncharacterized protein LOC125809113 [Solanum verrucosum]|uniref:uncharacterized protein LOC125809113 n=1 Tax=Solanum verrucosum TaxID=315347 RepID=UPI0020D02897|nr:uncharacterized protein LOC125809113 [Solanum verrucosum]
MKELVTKKRSLDYEMIELPHSGSAFMTNDSITKREDPGAFIIPWTIGMLQFTKALCDLGASINLMPYAIYKQLGLGEPKATTMRLLMADRSIKHPVGILYVILVKVDRFIFLVDFVILDYEIDADIPIILGRPFLATGRALVDVESGKLMFCVNNNEVTFNICRSMKKSSNIHVLSTENVIDEVVASVSHLMRKNEPLEFVLANDDESEVQGYEEVVATLSGLGVNSRNPIKLDIDLKNKENPPAKPSTEEPPNLELKDLPSHLKYAFLGANNTLLVIIVADLLERQVQLLIEVLWKLIKAIGWTIVDTVGIPPGICTHKIRLDSECKLSVEHQRRLNPPMQEVVKKEIIKWLDAGVIYPIADTKWVSSVQCVSKKGGIIVVPNAKGGLVPTRPVRWRVCMDYRKLNSWIEMLDRLSERGWYCFLDGYSGYDQITIAPEDQEKTIFTYPYGTFAFKRMPFRLCNAPTTFQHSMLSIFTDMVKDTMEVFMDDFLVVRDTFEECLKHLGQVLQRCMDTNLCLKEKLISTLIIINPNWSESFELMCDASGMALGVVLGQKRNKLFHPIYYASKTLNSAQPNYTVTEQELLAVVYAFEKFRAYLLGTKVILHTDHTALRYLLAKKDAKPQLIRWILLLQEFDFEVKDRKGCENQVANHLSRFEVRENVEHEADIDDLFPDEQVFAIYFKHTPWYADFANYIRCGLIPDELTFYQRKRFMFDVKMYIWDEPYLFRECADYVIRRCITEEEAVEILHACHTSPVGGHHGGIRTAPKVL